MPRSGVIGEQIFDQVEKLVAGGMNRTQAFAEISKESGRQAGTVAANYYRVARKRAGGSLRKPRRTAGRKAKTVAAKSAAVVAAPRRGRGRPARSAPKRSAAASTVAARGDIDAIAAQLVANVQALASAVKSQAAEVQDLRKRLDGARKLLG
jgi:hypothetical protein